MVADVSWICLLVLRTLVGGITIFTEREEIMVSPAHIREAEKFGMPVVEPEVLRCRQCDAKRKDDDIDKCDDCGRECCPKCWVWIPDVALRFCSESCARTRLLKLLAAAEMNDKPVEHCKDCCCARSWSALGITGYTGKSIVEHITELKAKSNKPITEHPDVQRLVGQVVELQAENERLKEENRWIPVKERLPEEEGIYLTKYKGDGRQQLNRKLWIRAYPFGGIFTEHWTSKKPSKYSITHWKPITLPEQALKGNQ